MTDVIAAVACGYGWENIKTYAHSVAKSGFTGRKLIFAADCGQDLSFIAASLGFEIVPFEVSGVITVQRYRLFADWLRDNSDTRYALLLDCRDVVVQTDPSEWLMKHSGDIYAASECMRIGDQPTNRQWIESLYGEQVCQGLQDHDVLCAGTMVGNADAIFRLSEAIWRDCQKAPTWGSEQAALNVLARAEFCDRVNIPKMSEGLVLSCSWVANTPGNMERFRPLLTDEEPELRDGIAYPKGSEVPFAIVHQYDRDPYWKSSISYRYQ